MTIADVRGALDGRAPTSTTARTSTPARAAPGGSTASPRIAWAFAAAYGVVMVAVAAGLAGTAVAGALIAGSALAIAIGMRLNRPALSWPFWGFVVAGVFWMFAAAARSATGSTGDLTGGRSILPDVLALPGYGAYGVGLCAMVRARDGRNRGALIDAMVVSVAGFLLAWQFLISKTLSSSGVSSVAQGSIVVYPVLGCAFVALACRLAFASSSRLPVHGFLLLGMVGLLIGDVMYVLEELAIVELGARRDLGYMLAAAATGAAGLHPSTRAMQVRVPHHGRPLPMARAALLALSMLLPAGLFIYGIDTAAVRALPFQLGAIALAGIASIRLLDSVRTQNIAADTLSWQAGHDSLTGLPNRNTVTTFINEMLHERGRELVIAYFDLDQFKHVNDALGHAFGDRLLVGVADRLRGRLPEPVVLGRIGGDEFVAIGDAEFVTPEELAAYIQSALAHPFIVDGLAASTSASIGLTLSCGERDADAILRDADTAMYQAKESGRDTARLFSDDMRVQVERRMLVERSLRDALERGGELSAWFQPVIDLDSEETVGFEALARWITPGGPISPVEFIGVAEEAGLIGQLGALVLDQACAGIARARRRTGRDLFVAVNVSVRQLADDSIVDVVADTLSRHQLPGDALCLEITESIMVNDHNIERLYALRRLGVWLAVDDFGTGYSSLSYLRRMPVAKVKIDKSFVDDIGHGDSSIMVAILSMAHSLGLSCVAEGVEHEEQARRMRELGCDSAQGYLWAAPAPIDRALAALAPATPVG
jgi:diguanylate cyclase (GGDEF)-like protein